MFGTLSPEVISTAERRMFAKAIIGSARFLRMPSTSRLLYYDLGMDADDDGYVEAFTVMRKTGANDNDLRVLESKGFVRVLNDDLVSLILDWKTNNYIKSDRYHPSIYAKLIENPPLDTECIQTVSEVDTEVRLGKDSIDKNSIGNSVAYEPPPAPPNTGGGGDKPQKHKYGEYQNVLLTDDDLLKLKSEFPADWDRRIEKLSAYMASTGKKYKNHLATVRNWAKREQEEVKNNGKVDVPSIRIIDQSI